MCFCAHNASWFLWVSFWVLLIHYWRELFFSTLPPPSLSSPPSLLELTDQSRLRNPKEESEKRRSKEERACQISPIAVSLSLSPLLPSIRPIFQPPSLNLPPTFPLIILLGFLSILSWFVTPECMMCWFIAKLCRHTPAIAKINPSDLVLMKQPLVCLCVSCVRVRWWTSIFCHSTLIMHPRLKMGSCAPFWQSRAGPRAWLCAVLMISLRDRSERNNG